MANTQYDTEAQDDLVESYDENADGDEVVDESEEQENKKGKQSDPNKSKKQMFIVIGLVAFAAIVFVGYKVFLEKPKQVAKKPVASTVASAPTAPAAPALAAAPAAPITPDPMAAGGAPQMPMGAQMPAPAAPNMPDPMAAGGAPQMPMGAQMPTPTAPAAPSMPDPMAAGGAPQMPMGGQMPAPMAPNMPDPMAAGMPSNNTTPIQAEQLSGIERGLAMITQKLDSIESMYKGLESLQIADRLQKLEERVANLEKRPATGSSSVKSSGNATARKASSSGSSLSKSAPRVEGFLVYPGTEAAGRMAPVSKAQASGYEQHREYVLQAVIPGRMWVRTQDGASLTYEVGETLPNGAKVLRIDPDNGRVQTSKGALE